MASKAPPNPYLIDKPLDSDTGFFGREEIIQEIERVMRYPPHTSVILPGQRRIGKTSLLLALERRLPAPPFFPIYFDLSGQGLKSVGQVLHQMAVTAAKKADMSPPAARDFEGNPAAFHEKFLPDLYQAIGSERQPIFLLDEFKPIPTPEEELSERAAARALDVYLYTLLTTQSYTDFIFTAGRRMPEITNVTESGFQADLTSTISVLSMEQTRALIVQEGVKGIPQYEKDAIKRILDLTRGHPHLTQLVCHHLYNRAYERSRRKPRVTADDVEAIIPVVIEADDIALPVIWESIPAPERIILSAIASRATDENDVLNEAVITAALNETGVSPQTSGLSSAPGNLVNWRVLEQTGNSYSFHNDLTRLWVAKNHALARVKSDEMALLDPNAESLYQEAVRDHKAGRDDEAIEKLHRVLAVNPNHVPARLLLGSILRNRDQLTESVAHLEEAHKLDPAAAAGLLIATLLLLGAAYDKVRNFGDSLAVYKRVLEIDPENQVAKVRLAAAQAALDEHKRKAAALQKAELEETRQEREKNRRWVWVALLALLLLPLLCLAAWWGYNQQTATSNQAVAATQTAEAGAEGTRVAAATNAAALTATAGQSTAMAEGSATAEGSDTAEGSGSSQPTEETAPDSAAAMTTAEAEAQANATAAAAATAAATVAASATAAAGSDTSGDELDQIRVIGSDTMQPVIQDLAVAFTNKNPGVQVVIQSDGSAAGLEALDNDETDISMVARDLSPDEAAALEDVQVLPIAKNDPIAVISHVLVPVDNLTTQQIQDIYTGNITNWSELGGPDAPIQVYSSAEDSDTRTVFEQTVLGQSGFIANGGIAAEETSDETVRNAVSSQPYALGFTSQQFAVSDLDIPEDATESWLVTDHGLLDVQVLSLDASAPTAENANNGSYPANRPFNIVTKDPPNEVTQDWIDFIFSPEGREIIERSGHTSAP